VRLKKRPAEVEGVARIYEMNFNGGRKRAGWPCGKIFAALGSRFVDHRRTLMPPSAWGRYKIRLIFGIKCGQFTLFDHPTILDHADNRRSGSGKRHGFGRWRGAQAVRLMSEL
jgi:hypothetical protein